MRARMSRSLLFKRGGLAMMGLIGGGMLLSSRGGAGEVLHATSGPGHHTAVPENPENSVCRITVGIAGNEVGHIDVELFDDTVPKTAKNYRVLCGGEYKYWAEKNSMTPPSSFWGSAPKMSYANTKMHRIIPGFMAQAGDFTNENGTGGMSIYGRTFPDESFRGKAGKHYRGSLSMANAGRDTNGSQFFITFQETSWLNGKHVVFGQVLEGSNVLKLLEQQGTASGATKTTCSIISTKVLRGPSGSLKHLADDEAPLTTA
eukprot:TRINITY_DN12038_c0_g1_i1.p1 TRINITY_DN12038_c0_g1~~TRINITY_DN12038_c0_g1_i1.p1  ORF type:complete len:277 (+),score=51.09 TRINITY_DN12038_c0_g1_i1:54-833(+)